MSAFPNKCRIMERFVFLFQLAPLLWGSIRRLDSIVRMKILFMIVLLWLVLEIGEQWKDPWDFHLEVLIWLCLACLVSLALLFHF